MKVASWCFLWGVANSSSLAWALQVNRPGGVPVSGDGDGRISLTLEQEVVRAQLGYLPPNFVQVSAWTADHDTPVACQTYPLNGGAARRRAKAAPSEKGMPSSPFPTLYWLSCPDISSAIADLERRGYVRRMEERLLLLDESHHKDWIHCHESYAMERWQTLSSKDQQLLEDQPRMKAMLLESGVAGTDFRSQMQPDGTFSPSVKCLHAHYAHFRSGGTLNLVGQWTHEMLSEQFPKLKL
jgi:hypothetical protein